ncbi:MAG: hypothetical protein AB7F43_15410 [Bacteriovoracia bacterium]
MQSELQLDPDPANETAIVTFSNDQRGQKRRRSETQHNNNQNTVPMLQFNVNNQSSSADMDTDTDVPPVQPQPSIRFKSSTPTAAASEHCTASTLVQTAIKLSIENYICDTVLRYGRARVELYNRQVALRSLNNHFTNNTLPKDLCFNVQTGNPYKKTVANRDALMAQEQAILHEAKLKILQQRIESAKAEVARLEDHCQLFKDIKRFQQLFVEEFPEKSLLTQVNQQDCADLYLFHLAEKTKNMDSYCRRKEDNYQKTLLKKQKTTPLTETVNEQDFRNNLQDIVYQNILAFANKYAAKKPDEKKRESSTRGKTDTPKPQKQQTKPVRNPNLNPNLKRTNPVRNPNPKRSKPVSNPNSKKKTPVPLPPEHPKQRSETRSSRQQSSDSRQPARSYASVLSSSKPDRRSYHDNNGYRQHPRFVYDEDDDGWFKVPSKRRIPKNVSSKDSRDVPKRRHI